jgi:predicted Zn-dependent peptidase
LWFTFSSRDAERVERAFEILHTVVSRPRFEDKALERAKRGNL